MTRLTISLVALLSLLGVPSATAAPGPAQLIAPSGDVTGSTITFSWQSEPTATWYQFWLGKGTPSGTALVMQQWYTAEQAHCASGGTCTITVTPAVNAGGHTWFVQTYNASGYGPWSTGMGFSMKDPMPNWSGRLPDARRFTLMLNDLAVLDNETGLVWERQPATFLLTWASASTQCLMTRVIANRRGWRLPTAAELTSLLDNSAAGAALPAGHPFVLGGTGGNSGYFWTQTSFAPEPTQKIVGYFDSSGGTSNAPTTFTVRTWCVRSPSVAGS